MKIFKIWTLIIVFISQGYTQQITQIIPLSKNIHSISIIDNSENPIITYKNTGILYAIESEEDFPGKRISGIDSLTIKNNFFIARKNKFWGVLDIESNKFIMPAVYDNVVPIFDMNLFFANKYGATTVIDASNNKIIPFKPDNILNPHKKIGRLDENHIIYDYKVKNKYFIKTIPENYEFDDNKKPVDLYVLNNDVFILKFKDPKHWELHKTGMDKVQFKSKGRPYKAYNDGIVFMLMRRYRLQNFIDYDGKTILPFNFGRIQKIDNKGNYMVTSKSRKKGLFNIEKGFLIDTVCKKISIVSKDDNIILINKINGKSFLYSLKDQGILNYCKTAKLLGNNILVGEKNKFGLISKDGQIIYKNNWEKVDNLFPDLFVVSKNGKQALLNANGDFVTLFQNVKYKKYKNFFIQKQKQDGTKKYYDKNLNELAEDKLNFEVIKTFNNYLLVKNKYGKYGLINPQLEAMLPFKYTNIHYLKDNYFVIKVKNETGLIRVEGEL